MSFRALDYMEADAIITAGKIKPGAGREFLQLSSLDVIAAQIAVLFPGEQLQSKINQIILTIDSIYQFYLTTS